MNVETAQDPGEVEKTDLEPLGLDEFVALFHELCGHHRLVFFLGAGCSVTSGIPTGSQLAMSWLIRLAKQHRIAESGFRDWANRTFCAQDVVSNPGAHYSAICKKVFRTQPQLSHEIQTLVENKFPGYGYALLATLITDHRYMPRTKLVLTTNFDNLLADALYLFTVRRPSVLTHESLFGYSNPDADLVQIIKLHGHPELDPINLNDQMDKQEGHIVRVFSELPKDSALVFVGYGGHDPNIVSALKKVGVEGLRSGAFWLSSDPPPSHLWKEILAWEQGRFRWVKHRDFDTLMLALADELELKPPTLARADLLKTEYGRAIRRLGSRLERSVPTEEGAQVTLENHRRAVQKDIAQTLEAWVTKDLQGLSPGERNAVLDRMIRSPIFGDELRRSVTQAESTLPTDELSTGQVVGDAYKDFCHSPDHPESYLNLSRQLRMEGKHDVAAAKLKAAAEKWPSNADVLGEQAYLSAEDDEAGNLRVWERFESALTINPHHPKNLVQYAKRLLAAQDWMGMGRQQAHELAARLLRAFFFEPDVSERDKFDALYCAAFQFPDVAFPNAVRDLKGLCGVLVSANTREFDAKIIRHAEKLDSDVLSLLPLERINTQHFVSHFASTFLSHSVADKPLVEAVATELGKRGIIAWLDKDELFPGQDLTRALREAIRYQATLSVFVSEQALQSIWSETELATALDRYKKEELDDHIKDIYLGDPVALIRSNRLLTDWKYPKGSAVAELGIRADTGAPLDAQARSIAEALARGIYGSLRAEGQRDILINLDQRGSLRRGQPEGIPSQHRSIEGSTLVFRPRRGAGADKETIVGEEWDRLAATIQDALRVALKGPRWRDQKSIHVSGNAQLGLAYLIGHYFNRSTDAVLYCSDTSGNIYSNEDWGQEMLQGGNPDCEANAAAGLSPIPSTPFKEVALVVGPQEILGGAQRYLNTTRPDISIAWVRTPESPGGFRSSEEVRQLIADVTALAQRLERENGCRTAYLVLGLPFVAVPLFAAHMLHVLDRFVLLEYCGDLAVAINDANTYAQLNF